MTQKIVFLSDISDFNLIPSDVLLKHDHKIFSFGLDVHEKLESENIDHEIADNLLSEQERIQLFKKCVVFRSWQSELSTDDFEFKGVNLLKIFDTNEFHSFLILFLIKHVIIKKIIQKEKPIKIICTSLLSSTIKNLNTDNIETLFFTNDAEKKFFWDQINIKYILFGKNISFTISKINYLKIKKFIDSVTGFFSKSHLKSSKTKKKCILLLEFNTELFSRLLTQFNNYDGYLILVNERRPAIWNKKSFDIIKNSNCKILNFQQLLNKNEKQKIPLIVQEYSIKIENFFNSKVFQQFFKIENHSFWNAIKDDLIQSYLKKLPDFINRILCLKIIFHSMNIRCIVSLNEVGETEKSFLEFNNKQIPTIMLEHGFNETTLETKLFHTNELTKFNDKIAVWGTMKKNDLINNFNVDSNKILITGSPRHDEYFHSRLTTKFSNDITVLLAPNPITDFSGLANTELELKFKNTIKNIIFMLQQFKNVKIIVKLHQIQLKHNQKIKSMILKIDKNIKVYSSESVIDIINLSNVVLVISPEKFGTSTMLMESMILGKPTMNIVIGDTIPQFSHVIRNTVLTVSSKSNLKNHLEKILFNKNFQNELVNNADNFLNDFLTNQLNSSEKFASILKSY